MNTQETVQERRARKRGFYVAPLARVVRSTVHGETVFFTVVNPRDEIQKHHLQGTFYEPEELAIIARHFPVGGRFCDIGTNIGNHSLYVAKFLHASQIVMFEPNPAAIAILESNVQLNGIQAVCDRRFLGIGLSDKAADNASMRVPARNLGGSRVVEGEGDIRLATFDSLLPGAAFDLIKIDVERMELRVLAGMRNIIGAARPKVFIEVDAVNDPGFHAFLADVGYHVLDRFQRYVGNTNYLVGPA
jgi:FkbM family methyltransferase